MIKYKQQLITKYYDLKSIVIHNNEKNEKPSEKNNTLDIIIDSKYDSNQINYKFYGYNKKTDNWHCLECGENMGNNPRQLCGKSYCLNTF
jgi:formylmethanofuran dehydrogenase subunit E